MENGRAKSIGQRRGNNKWGRYRKTNRLRSSEKSKQTTKIIDLNDDCLVKIFEHLELKDLYMLSIASEWLRPAAADVYVRKFGTKPVQIRGCSDPEMDFDGLSPRENNSNIDIFSLRMCLQYLRFFGSSISSLLIDYDESMSKRFQYVDKYVNKYCADSLIEISFLFMTNTIIEPFEKQFVSVESLKIYSCELAKNLPSFAEWFPNVRRLELIYTHVNSRHIEVTFRHLEHLSIRVDGHACFTPEDAKRLLRSNRHLRSLKLASMNEEKTNINTLLDIIKDNSSITKLVLTTCLNNSIQMNSSNLQVLVHNHPSLVELELPNCEMSSDNVAALIVQLNFLKKFCFRCWNARNYSKIVSKLDSEWHVSRLYKSNLISLERQI